MGLFVFWATVSLSAEPNAEASALLEPYKQNLKAALKAGMADGPLEAINACRVQAPDIAASYTADSVQVGRASARPRNPDNQAPAWVKPLLIDYQQGAEHRAHAETLRFREACVYRGARRATSTSTQAWISALSSSTLRP